MYNKYWLHGNSQLFVGSLPVLGVKVQMFVDIFYFFYSISGTCLWSDLSFSWTFILLFEHNIPKQDYSHGLIVLPLFPFDVGTTCRLDWRRHWQFHELVTPISLFLNLVHSPLELSMLRVIGFFFIFTLPCLSKYLFSLKEARTFHVAGRAHCPVFLWNVHFGSSLLTFTRPVMMMFRRCDCFLFWLASLAESKGAPSLAWSLFPAFPDSSCDAGRLFCLTTTAIVFPFNLMILLLCLHPCINLYYSLFCHVIQHCCAN